MEVGLAGTGGSAGWPQPGCRCASCERARSAGRRRAPAQVVVDGVLRIDSGRTPIRAPDAQHGGGGTSGGDVKPGVAGYRVERVPGGWDVTGRDGGRLLVGDGRGDGHGVPTVPPGGARPYDIVLLDMLEDPAQLGALRHRGLVHARTVVAVLHADHCVSSEEELARRCRFWGVIVPNDGDILAPAPGTGTARPATASTTALDTATASTATASTGSGLSQPRRVLVLGGARSGKSRHAELRLAPGQRPARRRLRVDRAGGGAPGQAPPVVADRGEPRCGRDPAF